MNASEFGQFISEMRKRNKLTQAELARKLDVTDKAVSRWERGLGFPDINTLEALADALGISLLELMQAKQNENNEPISTEQAEELLSDTIQLSNKLNKYVKFTGIQILSVFALIGFAVLFLLFSDWNSVYYIVPGIIAGLIAWGIPIWKMTISRSCPIAVPLIISFSCALTAIALIITNMAHDIHTNDMVAVIDTIDGIVAVVFLFIAVTIVLNILSLICSRKK